MQCWCQCQLLLQAGRRERQGLLVLPEENCKKVTPITPKHNLSCPAGHIENKFRGFQILPNGYLNWNVSLDFLGLVKTNTAPLGEK